jgi:hypothetical protein
MPEYLKRTGRDVTDDILVRVPEAEKTVARLRGPASKRLGIDRGSIPSVAAPLEGQMMIQYADEAVGSTPVSPDVGTTFIGEIPYYYSNGEWRPFSLTFTPTAAEEHLQVASTTCAATDTTVFVWSHYDGASIVDLSTTTQAKITVHGVYAVTAELTIFLPAVEPAGDAFDVWLKANQAAPAWPPGDVPPSNVTAITSSDTFETVQVVVPRTAVMAVADFFSLEIFNRASYDVDVVAAISVVKILELT